MLPPPGAGVPEFFQPVGSILVTCQPDFCWISGMSLFMGSGSGNFCNKGEHNQISIEMGT